MYNPNSIDLIYASGNYGALSNICHGNGYNRWASVMDLMDAVEDSDNAQQLLLNLSKLNFVGMSGLTIDRDSALYTRIKGSGALGDIRYLKIGKV